jgi:hypothetical protein
VTGDDTNMWDHALNRRKERRAEIKGQMRLLYLCTAAESTISARLGPTTAECKHFRKGDPTN